MQEQIRLDDKEDSSLKPLQSRSVVSDRLSGRTSSYPALEILEPRLLLSAADQTMQLFDMQPALFVENQGQWADASVLYAFQGPGVSVSFSESALRFQVIQVQSSEEPDDPNPEGIPSDDATALAAEFSASFDGANAVSPIAMDRAATVYNYLLGGQADWHSGVPSFESILYEGLYEGIDLLTRGTQSGLKYEFRVAPGADYQQILVSYTGIDGLSIDAEGALHVQTSLGELIDEAPRLYQDIDGARVEVTGAYQLIDSDTYTFTVTGAYDGTQELIIDPDLAWSTYLGGTYSDYAHGVAVDASGNALVTGQTRSPGWVSGGFDTSYSSYDDAFVVKVDPEGGHLWSTYLGGAQHDRGYGITVDASGNVLVAGETYSSDWGVSGGYDTTWNGGADAFVVKLDAAGNHLWSTYLGGTSHDGLEEDGDGAIAVDASGDVFVTGWTRSADSWVSGGFNDVYNGGLEDAFVARLSASGGHVWSTYLGGGDYESGTGVVVDSSGDVLVAGYSRSQGWVSGGFDETQNGEIDGFAAKLSANGGFVWSTYLGGDFLDYAWGIAVDSADNTLVTGDTSSSAWVSGGFNTTASGWDAFVVKLSPSGGHTWSTYVGGTAGDRGFGIAVDAADNVLVTGDTSSTDWVSGGYDTDPNGMVDAFAAELSASGAHLWSTYLGGSDRDYGRGGIAVDNSGNIFAAGWTRSSGWVSGGFDTTSNGFDGYLVKLAADEVPPSLYAGLLADVNVASPNSMDDTPVPEICVIGNTAYFTANDGVHGMELWKTNGTEAGTEMVKDINTGWEGSSPHALTNFSGMLLFAADDGDYGVELWRSDGTAAGTVRITNIGSPDADPTELTVVGDLLYFRATDGESARQKGYELWVSDGTTAGTSRVANLVADAGTSDPSELTNVNGTLFFTAWTEEAGYELWKVDASGAAVMVKDLYPGALSSTPHWLTEMNGKLYFSANEKRYDASYESLWSRELWVSDGTAAGTVVAAQIRPGIPGSDPNQLTVLGDTLYFVAYTPEYSHELWKYTEAGGASLVKDVNAEPEANPQGNLPPGATKPAYPEQLTVFGDRLVFNAWDGIHGWKDLWITDGTAANTVPVQPDFLSTRAQRTKYMTVMDGVLYFQALGPGGYELWKSDGTQDGTVIVKNIRPWSAYSWPAYLTVFGNTLLFAADDGTHGFELWTSDGTESGTVLVKDINIDAASSLSDDPETQFVEVAGTGMVFFAADNGANGTELWMTDGTAAGTRIVRDPTYSPASLSPIELVDGGNGVLYFSSYNSTSDGRELWRAYQTTSGSWTTALVKDINTVGGGSDPADLTVVGNTLFFTADDGDVTEKHGRELWKVDLTTGVASMVKDIVVGVGSSNPTELTAVGNTLFFTAWDEDHGYELWKSDGTDAGTVMVKDIRVDTYGTGFHSSSPSWLTEMNGLLYFAATGQAGAYAYDNELWVSDGTQAGTVMVADIWSGANGSNPAQLKAVGDTLYFSAYDGTSTGLELWKYTEAGGAELVKDINPTPWMASYPGQMTEMNGILYFTAYSPTYGYKELFRSDGTEAGTCAIDIVPGTDAASPQYLTPVNGTLYFSAAASPQLGRELWQYTESDGAQLFADINPAPWYGSNPSYLTGALGSLIFAANDGTHGFEPWIVLVNTPPATADDAYDVDEDDTLTIAAPGVLANDTDVDGHAIEAVLVDDVSHGALTLNADGSFTYTPDPDFYGTDIFTYRTYDGYDYGDVATVTITVNSMPEGVQLVNPIDDVTVDEDAGDTIIGLSSVFGPVELGVTVTYSVETNTNPTLVSADIDGTTLTLSYVADQNGTAEITVRATDSNGYFADDTFLVTVNSVNDAPTVANVIGSVTVNEDAEDTLIDLSGVFADVDIATNGDLLTLDLVGNTNPGLVTASLMDSTLTLSYAGNQNGSAQITIRATDTTGEYVEDNFTVTVNAVNDIPMIVDPIADVMVDEDAPDSVLDLSAVFADVDIATDADSLALSVSGNTNPGLVGAALSDSTLTLSYAANQNGEAQITIRATDTAGEYVEDTFTVTVNAVNDTPTVANPIADVTVDEDAEPTTVDISDVFEDVDILTNADALTFEVTGNTNEGLVTAALAGTDLTLSYADDVNGTSQVTVRATDASGASVEDTFTVNVNPVNDAPTAAPQSVTTDEDQSIEITLGASDLETAYEDLIFNAPTRSAHGSLTELSHGRYLYQPDAGYAGPDSFEFTVTDAGDPTGGDLGWGYDGPATSAAATVAIEVRNLVDLSGRIFEDRDNNGLFDLSDGDTALAGVEVQLLDAAHTVVDTQTTDAQGAYRFENLGEGVYRIAAAQAVGYLDGKESAGGVGGIVDNTRDSNEIGSIAVGPAGTTPDASGYDFAELVPASMQGLVWEDFNNDGEVDLGELAIESATIHLTGTDDRGNAVDLTQATDSEGIFEFVDLRPGTYAITETQPDGFIDGQDVLGEVVEMPPGNVRGADGQVGPANDQFTEIGLVAGAGGVNYNFAERIENGQVHTGQTATIGFWQNKNGQALIRSLNGSSESTMLGNWLAATFPNMYGSLTGTSNDDVADLYKELFKRNAKTSPGGPPKLDAQVLATALAVYVTRESLVSLNAAGGTDANLVDTVASFGFEVTAGGVGSAIFNIGDNGEAFDGYDDYDDVMVIDLLLATDRMSLSGLLYDDVNGDGVGDGIIDNFEALLRTLANEVYSAINEQGDI